MEPYGNDLQTHVGDSDSKSIKGKRVAEDLSYSFRREDGAQPLNLLNEGQTSSRRGYNLEIYSKRREISIENSIPEAKIRKKNPTCCSLESLANFSQEDSGEIMKDIYKWKRYQQISTEGLHFPGFYKCSHTGCTMKIHTESHSLHPDKIMVSYEGVHNHCNMHASPSQKPTTNREEIMQRLQSPSFFILKLDQYIEQLKPNYGIFLKHPSKIKYGVMDNHIADSVDSGYEEHHQAFYAMNNVCHPNFYCNSTHNPYHLQQLQQVNNAECCSIPFPGLFSGLEPSITLGIQCTDLAMAGGEINFQYNLMQRNYNAGYYTLKPLAYEQPSSSLMAGGVIDDDEQLKWIHPSNFQLDGNLTEN